MSCCRAAEMAKLLENTFRMVNIALVNELAMLCADQGIDVWEVIEAAATKPFGFMAFYPGPGVGGHCIPLDPTYLAWQSRRDTGRPFRLVELAQDINAEMPGYVASRIVDALNDRGKALNGARDPRARRHLQARRRRRARVRRDRGAGAPARQGRRGQLPRPVRRARSTPAPSRSTASPLDAAAFEGADCVVLLTPHRDYDLDDLIARSPLLFDARNATAGRAAPNVVVL